MKKHKGTL